MMFAADTETAASEYFVYIGTFTAAPSKGIHAYRFHPSMAKLTSLGTVAEAPNPSFLTVSSDGKFHYAVNWKGGETVPGDTVSAMGSALTGVSSPSSTRLHRMARCPRTWHLDAPVTRSW